MQPRGRRKTMVGAVVSHKMEKTVSVRVDRLVKHPKFERYVRRSHTFMVHDEHNTCQPGDKVKIVESRPLSRRKRWRVVAILERAASGTAGGSP